MANKTQNSCPTNSSSCFLVRIGAIGIVCACGESSGRLSSEWRSMELVMRRGEEESEKFEF